MLRTIVASGALFASTMALAADDPQGIRLNAWGYDNSAIDHSAKPGDGFDQYANGAWESRVTIPADRQGWTVGSVSVEKELVQLRTLLESDDVGHAARPATTNGKVGAFYASYMDEARIAALGTKPLQPGLTAIDKASDRTALAVLMGRNTYDFHGSIITAGIFADLKNPEINTDYLSQPTFVLPDRDYYLKPEFAAKKQAYQAYVAKMLELVAWPDPTANAAAIVDYETKISEASWTKVEQRDVTKEYNPRTLTGLEREAPGFPWQAYLKSAGFPDQIIVGEITAFPKIAKIYAETPLPVLKAWAAFTLADNSATLLPPAFDEAYFRFHAGVLNGVEAEQPRWKRAVHQVSGGDFLYGERSELFGNMGWAVGDAYVAEYFPPASKAAMVTLVANLRKAGAERIRAADWLVPSSKAEALKKLTALQVKIGYPDRQRRDYRPLLVDRTDLYGNVQRAAEFEWRHQLGWIGKPIDRDEWAMTPQTLDAYNGGPTNQIAFPAGILQAPLYNPSADLAVNYGSIGAIIGHEITHSFDDQGRMFDATGTMRDWWSSSDAATFKARSAVLGALYSSYEPYPGAHVNGDLTMGENIADLGGLAIAYDAYHAALAGKPAPVIDGLTGDQRFFFGYAQSWRGVSREQAIRRQIATDPHSPRRYRIDGVVRNMDAWYAAFDVRPGDKLYLAPDKRARIW